MQERGWDDCATGLDTLMSGGTADEAVEAYLTEMSKYTHDLTDWTLNGLAGFRLSRSASKPRAPNDCAQGLQGMRSMGFGKSRRRSHYGSGLGIFLFLLPGVGVYTVLMLYPSLLSLYYSVLDWEGGPVSRRALRRA